jgi:hypothetical protein
MEYPHLVYLQYKGKGKDKDIYNINGEFSWNDPGMMVKRL